MNQTQILIQKPKTSRESELDVYQQNRKDLMGDNMTDNQSNDIKKLNDKLFHH